MVFIWIIIFLENSTNISSSKSYSIQYSEKYPCIECSCMKIEPNRADTNQYEGRKI